MRTLVCGGRTYADLPCIVHTLDKAGITLLIHGGCSRLDEKTGLTVGADHFAGRWADLRGVPCMVFPAPWERFQARAGSIRNQWMLDYGQPQAVIAFPGGRGTADMIGRAIHSGLSVSRVNPVNGALEVLR